MKDSNELSPQEIKAMSEHDKSLPVLPPQVKMHFPDMTSAQELQLRVIYSGSKERPNFVEWVESFLVSDLLAAVMEGKDMLDNIKKAIVEHEASRDSLVSDDEIKAYDKKLTRLQKFHQSIADQRFSFMKELRVTAQANLARETPKKVQTQVMQITPKDIKEFIQQ